jgi:hypothetical protein
VNVQVKSYRPAFFKLAGTLIVSQDALPDKVLAAVEQILRTQFSFDARASGNR